MKNFLVSVPLVADLRSPAMRDRHWNQLMEATKVSTGWVPCLVAVVIHSTARRLSEVWCCGCFIGAASTSLLCSRDKRSTVRGGLVTGGDPHR